MAAERAEAPPQHGAAPPALRRAAAEPLALRCALALGYHRWYGVCVLAAALLGALATAPSHSYVVGLYTEALARASSSDLWQVNALWSLAMVGAAGVLAVAGTCVDSLGPTAAFCAAGLTLAAAVAVLSYVRECGGMLAAFLLIRCCGSGLMLTAINKAVNSWWVRRRGLANAVAACGISAAISTPTACLWLSEWVGWRAGLRVVAACVTGATLLVAFVLLDNPFDHGLRADCAPPLLDGPSVRGLRRVPSLARVGMSRSQATRHLIFWVICAAALLTDVFFVGFNLHAIAVMQERGVSEAEASGVFISISTAHVAGTLFYGVAVVDAVRDKRRLLVINTAVACAAMLAGAYFHGMRMAHVFGVIFGAMHAMVFLSLDATIPHFFGLLHLGSISGLARGISFFGGATGPLLFDLCKSLTGHYSAAMCGCAGLMAAVGALACCASDPTAPPEVCAPDSAAAPPAKAAHLCEVQWQDESAQLIPAS
eukprot:TRINITY_DN24417_c0_g1_i2.p1 TRINITY_DN24417_c0_g1~~TRINITY_DN24417_c0_g1_i2.p1  ORF type:complete len:513 (+),score=174.53 TRINITY_DN24417_c0_g1_i2:88-1539(+)